MKQLITLLFFLQLFLPKMLQPAGAQKLAAFKQHQLLLQQSPYKNIQWRLTGPDNRSGRSTDVAGITGNPNIMYAAYATGGLWKTEDAGETWKPIFDKEATQSIGILPLHHLILMCCMLAPEKQIFFVLHCPERECINQ